MVSHVRGIYSVNIFLSRGWMVFYWFSLGRVVLPRLVQAHVAVGEGLPMRREARIPCSPLDPEKTEPELPGAETSASSPTDTRLHAFVSNLISRNRIIEEAGGCCSGFEFPFDTSEDFLLAAAPHPLPCLLSFSPHPSPPFPFPLLSSKQGGRSVSFLSVNHSL